MYHGSPRRTSRPDGSEVLRVPADLRAARPRSSVLQVGTDEQWSERRSAASLPGDTLKRAEPSRDPVHHPPDALGAGALHRRDDGHVRHLLHHPRRPGALVAARRARPRTSSGSAHYLGTRQARLVPVRRSSSKRLVDSTESLGRSFANRQDVNTIVGRSRAGDRVARLRRRDLLDADRAPARDPLGAAAALARSTESRWSSCSSGSRPTRSGSA